MPTEPTIARIWRGRTRPGIADDYESYIKTKEFLRWRRRRWAFSYSGKTVNMRAGSRPSPIGRTSTR